MAHIAQSVAGVTTATGIVAYIRNFRDALATNARRDQVYRRNLAELRSMSDNDLADLGITRYMIPEIATESAARA